MGGTDADAYPADGEGPQRLVFCSSYRIAACTVSTRDFARFVSATGYLTDAEKFGWSYVFFEFVPRGSRSGLEFPQQTPWWLKVTGACWHSPEGPGSNLDKRGNHPVTHVSWFDAKAYCEWSETRLPTEAEWEYAARGGLEGKRFAWGDVLLSQGRHQCNIWQGSFPDNNTLDDGYLGTAPVNAFEPNGHGLYNCCGNVWEWCEDWFSPDYHRQTSDRNPTYSTPTGKRSMRGGSFLCHRSYCHRYRLAARSSTSPDSSTNHCGFRVAADL